MGEIITYNVKIQFPNPQEEKFWLELLKEERDAFNLASKLVYTNKPKIDLKEVFDLVYHKIRNTSKLLPAQGANKVIKEVIGCFRSIRSNGFIITEAPEKKNLSMRLDKRMYSHLEKNSIKITSSEKGKRILINFQTYPKFNEMAEKYVMRDPLIFNRDGTFYLSVSFDVPEKPVQNETVLGVDLGIRRLYTTSDGTSLLGKEFSRNKRRIRYLKRMLKHTNTSSSKKHLLKVRHYEHNFSKKYIELAVNELLKTDKSVIVIEDLTGLKTNKKGKRSKAHNNRISQVPFYLFKQILSYKAPLVGKTVETVNPAYTSQIDSMTGKKEGERKFVRFYSTSGTVYDADWNAANNIARKSEHPFSCEVPFDGSLHFLGRLLSTSQKFDRDSVEPTEQASIL